MEKEPSFSKWSRVVTPRMGDRYVLGSVPVPTFLRTSCVQTLQKSFGWDRVKLPHVHTQAKRSHMHTQAKRSHVHTQAKRSHVHTQAKRSHVHTQAKRSHVHTQAKRSHVHTQAKRSHVHTQAKRSHTHVKDPAGQVRFGGLWKHQNNPHVLKKQSASLQTAEVEH